MTASRNDPVRQHCVEVAQHLREIRPRWIPSVEQRPDRYGEMAALVEVMDRLRDPVEGCPWDAEQTWTTLKSYMLEEAHELVHAIESDDPEAVCEELGDMLFEVVFMARVAEDRKQGAFGLPDAVRSIVTKLIRRHPHVFGDHPTRDPDEIQRNWNRIKAEEKAEKARRRAERDALAPQDGAPELADGQRSVISTRPESVVDGVPRHLPALLQALRLGERARSLGFDWEQPLDVFGKVAEELDELREAAANLAQLTSSPGHPLPTVAAATTDGSPSAAPNASVPRPSPEAIAAARAHLADEMGDVLFTVVNVARNFGVNPEDALRAACDKFRTRFVAMEAVVRESGRELTELSFDEKDAAWNEGKRRLRAAPKNGPRTEGYSPAS